MRLRSAVVTALVLAVLALTLLIGDRSSAAVIRGAGPRLTRPPDFHLQLPDPSLRATPKLTSQLGRLVRADRAARATGAGISSGNLLPLADDLRSAVANRRMRIDASGRVQVYVEAGKDLAGAQAAVRSAGGEVELSDAKSGTVQAEMPIARIEHAAAFSAVQLIRLPDYPIRNAGSVTSQGDSILRAALFRSTYGLDGTGVKVGVISDGIEGLASSQATGDVPASVNYTTCNEVAQSPTSAGAGAEGTAMMEIVHDLAPGAQLWFGHFGMNFSGTSLNFEAAVNCLAANTDVVVDDIAWANAGPYDGTSQISTNASNALNGSGPIRAYVTSVGNYAIAHYQGTYVKDPSPSNPTSFHQFSATSGTTDICALGPSLADALVLNPGGSIYVALQWNDTWGAATDDYDLYLVNDTTGAIAARSEDVQSVTGVPTEDLSYTNTTGVQEQFDIFINKFAGVAKNLNMFIFGEALLIGGCPNGQAVHNYNTPASSVANNNDAGGGVISVGAINASDPGNDTIAFYSSHGPTADSRIKPDVTGIDGVSVTGAAGFPNPFYGTSAAAPHVAAIAALLLSCRPDLKSGGVGDNPSADRAALHDALINPALDLGTLGMDNTYGKGRVDAINSQQSVCPDSDGDGEVDYLDNCPNWPNPAQNLPPWTVPANDPDCDGFSTTLETFLGTLPLKHCSASSSEDAWPPDLNRDKQVNILDVISMRPHFGSSPPSPAYSPRYDLNASGSINILDVMTLRPFFGKSCG